MSVQRFSKSSILGYSTNNIKDETIIVGGDTTIIGGYRIHQFTSTGLSKFIIQSVPFGTASTYKPSSLEYLVVAGGGGGFSGGGGGGAGGYLTSTFSSFISGVYDISVGSGGGIETNGNNSYFRYTNNSILDINSIGGGKGGPSPGNGGSGGGGYHNGSAAGTGTAGQGNSGGTGSGQCSSGGGGAGGVGGNAATYKGGAPGAGLASSITGTSVKRGGGGGGGGDTANSSNSVVSDSGGGIGSTTNGTNGGTGVANTGGGGGGGPWRSTTNVAGAGGSGTVIVRYPI